MNRGWFVVVAVLWATGLLGGRDLLAAEAVTVNLSKWTLFTDTANEIGPSASGSTKRFASNNLACQNCHL
jgi:cytochrome c